MGLKLMTDRHQFNSPITSQTGYPLRHAAQTVSLVGRQQVTVLLKLMHTSKA